MLNHTHQVYNILLPDTVDIYSESNSQPGSIVGTSAAVPFNGGFSSPNPIVNLQTMITLKAGTYYFVLYPTVSVDLDNMYRYQPAA